MHMFAKQTIRAADKLLITVQLFVWPFCIPTFIFNFYFVVCFQQKSCSSLIGGQIRNCMCIVMKTYGKSTWAKSMCCYWWTIRMKSIGWWDGCCAKRSVFWAIVKRMQRKRYPTFRRLVGHGNSANSSFWNVHLTRTRKSLDVKLVRSSIIRIQFG